MDSSDYSILIGRLEREAEERPKLYEARVALVAALGYAGVALPGVWLLASFWSVVASMLESGAPGGFALLSAFAALATLLGVVRALWFQGELPQERPITAEEAPELFAMIDDVARQLGGLVIDSVSISRDFTIELKQVASRGVFGGYTNHLVIGLPLLAALSVEEITAALAHEVGHSSAHYGRLNPWIYRQRATWRALERRLAESSNLFDALLARFYGWYAPYFNACSFALARRQEYLADELAAHGTDADIVGRALTKMALLERFVREIFWPRFLAQVERSRDPPYRPYAMMQRAFKAAQKMWANAQWIKEALHDYDADKDAHPGLADRLAALDIEPPQPSFDEETSALCLLEPSAALLIQYCDDAWRAENLAEWRKRHDEINEARWKIAEYEQYALTELGPEDLWAKAQLLFTVNRDAEGIATLEALVGRAGEHPRAHMMLGQLLLERQDERGLDHLLVAASQDPDLAPAAGAVGYDYLIRRGRKPEALRFRERIGANLAA